MSARSTKSLSSTSFYVLLALADADRYGLEIIEEIESRTEGEVLLGPGSLYNTIKRLSADGLIVETTARPGSDPRRRYYGITPEGRAQLTKEARGLDLVARIARAKNVLDGGPE